MSEGVDVQEGRQENSKGTTQVRFYGFAVLSGLTAVWPVTVKL